MSSSATSPGRYTGYCPNRTPAEAPRARFKGSPEPLAIYGSINALAETTNGLYKAECVYGPETNGWDDVDELALATLSWVHWFNEDRLHGHCHDVPPAEYEAAFYAAQDFNPARVGIQ